MKLGGGHTQLTDEQVRFFLGGAMVNALDEFEQRRMKELDEGIGVHNSIIQVGYLVGILRNDLVKRHLVKISINVGTIDEAVQQLAMILDSSGQTSYLSDAEGILKKAHQLAMNYKDINTKRRTV